MTRCPRSCALAMKFSSRALITRPPSVTSPRGPARLAAAIAAFTVSIESPRRSSRAGSMSIVSSRSRPPTTSSVETSSSPMRLSATASATRLRASSPYSLEWKVTASTGTSSTSALAMKGPAASRGRALRPLITRSASFVRDFSLSSPTLNCTVRIAAESRETDQTWSTPSIWLMRASRGRATLASTSAGSAPGRTAITPAAGIVI